MKVLIIGGTGLISTAISKEFLAKGIDLTLYNRGISDVRIPDGAKTVSGNRQDVETFEKQIADLGSFGCVIDMICFTPAQAESTIRACRGRAKQVIFCSTVDVYTKPADRYPILENESRHAGNGYGQNKVLCEDLFMSAHQRGDFAATIIRPAMTYGEGGKLVNLYGWGTYHLDRLRKGKPLIVHGDGSALWVACHIDDAAHAFVQAADNPVTFGQAYHVTGEEWFPWNHYYQLTAQAMNLPEPKLVHIPTDILGALMPKRSSPLVTNFQGNTIFDNSAAHRDLDFHYTIPFLEGARRTIEWLDAVDGVQSEVYDAIDDQILARWEQLSSGIVASLPNLDT
ncbi:MAG: NAD-dependent epimerase/dehydratase family protein [Chloroflexota bacterium]